MDSPREDRTVLITLAATVAVFVVGRFVGAALFDNGWSFAQWQGIPTWYIVAWFVFLAAAGLVFGRFFESIARFFATTTKSIVGGIALFAALFVFQFNSFLYGGGNAAVARVAQTPDPIFRWYEYGSNVVAWLLFRFYSLFDLHYNMAGVYAWKTLAFAAAALSILAAWKIAVALTEDPVQRCAAFILTFFGPQLLLMFGFVGVGPIVAAVTLWFALYAIRALDKYRAAPLIGMWLVVIIGCLFKATLVYLVPAAVFVSLVGLNRRRDTIPLVPILVAFAVWIGGLIALYGKAAGNLEWQSAILLFRGKNPFADYGLFSWRHIGDALQVLFLLLPLFVISKAIAWRHLGGFFRDRRQVALILMWVGGFSTMFVMDPTDSIVLDLPRLAAYLASGGVIIAALLVGRTFGAPFRPSTLGLIAAAAIVLPLSWLPAYLDIDYAEPPVKSYLDQHPAYYLTGAPAFRDAYFYRKDLDRANWWDQNYLRLSPDYLQLSGINEFAQAGHTDEALRSLTKLIARDPYWVEAHTLYASIQMNAQRYRLARPQLDTALMLAPYDRAARINQYAWYRDTGDNRRALEAVQATAKLYPSDSEIQTDLMLLHYRNGHVDTALAMADSLLAVDSTLAYPYAVRGFVADRAGRLQQAIDNYEKFANLAPDDPETPELRKRSNALYLKLHGEE